MQTPWGILILSVIGTILAVPVLKLTSRASAWIGKILISLFERFVRAHFQRKTEWFLTPAAKVLAEDATGRATTAFMIWHGIMFGVNFFSACVWLVLAIYCEGKSIFLSWVSAFSFVVFIIVIYAMLMRAVNLFMMYEAFFGGPLKDAQAAMLREKTPAEQSKH
jgi:hypothetical protein